LEYFIFLADGGAPKRKSRGPGYNPPTPHLRDGPAFCYDQQWILSLMRRFIGRKKHIFLLHLCLSGA